MKKILSSLKIIFTDPFYIILAFFVSLTTSYASYWLFNQTTTIPTFLDNMKAGDFGSYSYAYGISFIITTVLVIILSGVSVASAVWLFRHSKLGKGNIGANIGGITAAMFGMGCPVCGAFLLSLVGVVGGLSIFPLQGLELKFLSLGLLVGSIIFSASKVQAALACHECVGSIHDHTTAAPKKISSGVLILPLEKIVTAFLIVLFISNQILLSEVSVATGAAPSAGIVGQLLGIKTAPSKTIIAPKLNPDGRTTSLVEQPTITDVPANPNTGDALADAKVVMQPTGKPFYAPEDISFDDPINAQKKWKSIGFAIKLTPEQESRWKGLINTFTCNYCCGGPNNVTVIARCGCAHSFAWQGFFRYMIATYGDKYSDEQLKGEAFRWTGLWYPKGVLEDYLLATGKGDVLGHATHGGAGSNGRHGL